MRPLARPLPLSCFLGILLAALGCGRAGPPMGTVHGEVRLDGDPLPNGYVTFFSVDDSRAPAGTTIDAGTFKLQVPTGAVRVTITSIHVVRPAKLPHDEGDARERVPPRYNAKSELRFSVEQGDNTARFDLSSK